MTLIFSLIQDHVFPDQVRSEGRKEVPTIAMTNTGAMRFDIFKGPFTIDSMYAVSPFTSGFRAIEDVPFKIAETLLKILNQEVPQLWPVELATELRAKAPVPTRMLLASDNAEKSLDKPTTFAPPQHHRQNQAPLKATSQHVAEDSSDNDEDLTPGYTNTDDAGTDGDDTIHSKIKFYHVPNCIESRISFPPSSSSTSANNPEKVDLVYNSFLEKYILLALKFLGTAFDKDSTKEYLDGKSMTDVLGEWVQEHWNCEDENGLGSEL